MRSLYLALLAAACLSAAFAPAPKNSLEKAREKLAKAGYFKYSYTSLWPDPSGIVDTTHGSTSFSRVTGQLFEYDFVAKSPDYDLVYIDGNYSIINHEPKTVTLYSEKDLDKGKTLRQGSIIKNSPALLLKLPRLTFLKDTVINGKTLNDYMMIESDTVINSNKIVVERHMFIGSTSLLERAERRVIFNGKAGQKIVHLFYDYEMAGQPKKLVSPLPPDYKSQLYGTEEKIEPLAVGTQAPDFTLTDINGKIITLADLRGKKVLLDFSIINCGYCKLSLDHMNKKDFTFSSQFAPLYLSSGESAAAMNAFIKRVPVPMPVLVDAKAVAKAYGVYGFPTFFVVDENGVIEKVQVGYSEAFLDSLR